MVSIRYTIRIAHKEWKKDRNLFDIARECGTHTHNGQTNDNESFMSDFDSTLKIKY